MSGTNGAPAGYRVLRVGETMLETDVIPAAFGDLAPVRRPMIGNKVLGIRSGFEDVVFRKRKRSLPAPRPPGRI